MKIKLIMLVSLFAFGLAFSANAGAVADADSDLVPDGFDNCDARANGPGDASNQVDSDQDGYGNACDTDYNDDGFTTTLDFPVFVAAFTGGTDPNLDGLETDSNGDGSTTTLDFPQFVADFTAVGTGPGPSGLACAGLGAPCLP
jgi:hypothetical protein